MSIIKSLGGALKDKVAITASRVMEDEISRAILKVTSHDVEAPNEKHLQRLLNASRGQYEHGGKALDLTEMLAEIVKRTHVRDWIVVLKAMVTLHRLLQESSDQLAEKIIVKGAEIFNLRAHLKDLANSTVAHIQARFIRQYGRYLEERCVSSVNVRVRIEEENMSLDQKFTAECAKDVFLCLDSWDAVLKTIEEIEIIEEDVGRTALNVEALRCLIVDTKKFFAAISVRLIWLLKSISDVDRDKVVKQYEAYLKHIAVVNKFFEKARSVGVPHEDCVQLETPQFTLDKVRAICRGETSVGNEFGGSSSNTDDVEVAPLRSVIKNPNISTSSSTSSSSRPAKAAAATGRVAVTPPPQEEVSPTETSPTTQPTAQDDDLLGSILSSSQPPKPAKPAAPKRDILDDLFGGM